MKLFAIILLIALAITGLGVGFVFHITTPEQPDHVHAFGEWETKTPASCTEAEIEIRKCDCGEEETRDGDAATGHNYESVVTDPTCTEAGAVLYSCACGDTYTETIAAIGHTFGEWGVETPASCTAAGVETRACGCGEKETRPIEKLDHTFGEWETKTPASCTEAEIEARKCGCGEEETREGDAATGHTAASISAICTKTDAMKYDVLTAEDFIVTATCDCGENYTVTEGVTVENGTLALGENTVTVKVGELSASVAVEAVKFNVVVNGSVVDDTYVNSGNNTTNYSERPELYIYNTGMYRVLFRFNFTDVLNSPYYADFGEEAVVKFTFTVTNGVDLAELPVTFKSYLTSEVRSSVDFSELTWKNYSNTYTLGWGSDTDSNNTVSLLAKEPVGNRATYTDGKLVITVTLRELEGCIDANGNAIFVLLTAQKDVKPFIASMENEEFDIPVVSVIFSDDHVHAYIEEVVDEKYLASANCGETAKYYKSCSCGEASDVTFNYGETIDHSYGEFVETQAPTCTVEGVNTKTCGNCGDTQTEAIPVIPHSYEAVVTDPTCTEAGYTTYTCGCGDTYTSDEVAATGHSYGDWLYDESYHWVECGCGDTANKDTHSGGEATETEQAVCETCKQPYGGLASHVHNYEAVVTDPTCTEAGYTTYTCGCGDVYVADEVASIGHSYGEWESFSPAGCEVDEVLIHYCSCGANETGVGQAAFGHDMQTKYDENNHWTECAHNCGTSTEAVAHSGGTATETEKAVCEGCGQSYGELKPAEKQEYTVNGTVKDDTFVYSSWKTTDLSEREYLRVYNSDSRTYFRYNFSDIIGNADFVADKENAVVTFTFYFMTESFDYVNSSGQNKTMTVAAPTDSSTVIFRGFKTDASSINTDFSSITWTSVNTGNEYNDIHYANGTDVVNSTMNTENAKYENNVLTITVKYSDIEEYINSETGDALFVIATKTKSAFIYSTESEYKPTVSVTYTK